VRRWVAVTIGVLAAAAVGAYALLPERYAVNAPLGQLLLGRGQPAREEAVRSRIHVPEGFEFGIWADGLPGARFLRFTETGDLLLSQPRQGRVWLLEADGDGDGRSDGRRVLLDGLDRPHGLDLHDGWLYVGNSGAVVRVAFDAAARATSGEVETVVPDLPAGGNHWTRTVRFGPDGLLYVTIGSDCNVCIEKDPRRAAMLRYRADGSGQEIFAAGLRNSVGFDWRPGTNELYATDNGRDLLGDDFPPCELNRVVEGGFYGWPIANGDKVPDPDFGDGQQERIERSIAPVHGFRAHNAPLGMTFVRGTALPAAYHGAAIVALHGSWNRTRKDGYKVVSLHWEPGGIEERDLVWGFEKHGTVIGRPVDVAEGPDGALYVSDDYAGAVYRLAWVGAGAARTRAPTAAPVAGPADGQPLARLAPAEREARAERGAAFYRAGECAGCHEAAAAPAGVVVKPLEGLAQRHDLDELTAFLAAPTPPMPAVALPAEARRDLAVYLLSQHP
jgi:glucose/arabinose dehydrogenase